MFPQLGVTPRLTSKFTEIVAVVERYLVITRVKIKNQRSSRSEYAFLSVQAKWREKQNLFHEDKLNMNFQSNI